MCRLTFETESLLKGDNMQNKLTAKMYTHWFLVPAIGIYLIFFAAPNIMSFILGFTDWNVNFFNEINFIGLDNFKQLFSESIFWTAIKNSFYFAFITTLVQNLLGFALAIILCSKIKYTNFYRSVYFLPTTLSTMVVAIVFISLYDPSKGIINEALRTLGLDFLAQPWLVDPRFAMNSVSIMNIWQWTGLSLVIYIAGIQLIPNEYYESANIDGANYFQKIKNIMIPLSMPSIINNVLLAIVGGLKVFAQVYALTNGGPADSTQVFGTLIFKNFSQGLYGYSSAVGLVFTLTVCLLSFIFAGVLRKLEVEY